MRIKPGEAAAGLESRSMDTSFVAFDWPTVLAAISIFLFCVRYSMQLMDTRVLVCTLGFTFHIPPPFFFRLFFLGVGSLPLLG